MSKVRATQTVFLMLLALAASRAARGDEQSRTRVTIRGTGANVAIERTQAPARKHSSRTSAIPAGAIGEAVALKSSGADDVTVIGYLRAHEAEIPPIIEAADVRQLRRAGAGKTVVAYLTSVAAVDIGETGEGYETALSSAPSPEPALEPSLYGTPYGYPLVRGFVGPHPRRLSGHGLFPVRRPVLQPRRPPFRGAFPNRAVPGRRPMME